MRVIPIPVAPAAASAAAVAACVASAVGCDGGGGPFTALEREAIVARTGAWPAPVPPDPSNRFADDPAAAALGKLLFFDTWVSGNREVSCATCHDPDTGFQDIRANTSHGVGYTGRHSPTVINAAYAPWEFWDGRADSQWSQALRPPESPVEMGGSRTRVAYVIADHYAAEYEAIFGPLPVLRDPDGAPRFPLDARPGSDSWDTMHDADRDAITAVYVNFGKAVAAYERRLVSGPARFDALRADLAAGADDSDALDEQEKEGLRLFLGKGGCLECHDGPIFSDGKFHNVGVAQDGPHLLAVDRGRLRGIDTLLTSEFHCASRWSDHPDKVHCAVAGLTAVRRDGGAFKTPGLRQLSSTAPYMHTGTVATLTDVVAHYDRGGDATGFFGAVDPRVAPLGLAPSEAEALVAFLRTLDGAPPSDELIARPLLPE